MDILAINYDLKERDIEDYEDLFDAIKQLGSCHHAQGSFWLVKTAKTSAEVRDLLKVHLQSGDQLMISIFDGWASFNMKDTAAWINK